MDQVKRKITPYDYQTKQADEIIRKVVRDRTTIAQLPTGGGKTVEFSIIADRYIKAYPDKSVLILVHREELLQQAKNTIEEMYDHEVSLIVAGVKYVKKVHIYIGMVESVNTRAQFMPLLNLGLVIFDEVHMGNFTKMHNIFKTEMIIGFTATPISASKKTPLKNYYKRITVGPQISELIAIKRLAQNITYCPEDVVEETMLEVDARTGDFDMRQMAMVFGRPKYVMNTVLFYGQFCRKQKTIVFNVNVEHSLEVTSCFNFCGFPAKHIDGNTPFEERKKILEWFKETDDAILCNVGIATMGFDEPTIRNVIVNLSTLSVVKWIQMCGRGGRKLPGKDYFNVIDLGGNSVRFGDWNFDRDWEYLFYNPEKPGKAGLAPTKTCPKCNGLVHAAVIQCKLPSLTVPNEICGHIFDRKKMERERELGELIMITKGINVEEIIKQTTGKRAYYVVFEMGRIYVDKLLSSKLELNHAETEMFFKDYFTQVKLWHKRTFPGKVFREKWHYDLARKHFYEYLKFKKEQKNALAWLN